MLELLNAQTAWAEVCSKIWLCTYDGTRRVSASIDSVTGFVNGMSDATCNAHKMAVMWMESEFSQNKTKEGTLEYVNRCIQEADHPEHREECNHQRRVCHVLM